jgi:hypothetical protein
MQIGINPGHLRAGLRQVELPLDGFRQGTPVSADRIEFTLQLLFIGDPFLEDRPPQNGKLQLGDVQP